LNELMGAKHLSKKTPKPRNGLENLHYPYLLPCDCTRDDYYEAYPCMDPLLLMDFSVRE